MADKNPEALSELNKVEITQELKDFVKDSAQLAVEEKLNRAFWETNVDRYLNLRWGIRSPKTFPWPNCANFMIPLIDADINRIKPSYVNLASATPVCTFEPYGAEDIEVARKAEKLHDWRLRTKVNFFEPYVTGIDYLLQQGIVVWKVTWNYTTKNFAKYLDLSELDEQTLSALYDPIVTDEMLAKIIKEEFMIDTSLEENQKEIERVVKEFREGETKFEIILTEIDNNQPELTPINVREDLIFPINTSDINQARFIDYRFAVSKNDIKISMRDGKYEKYPEEEIDTWSGAEPLNRRKKNITRNSNYARRDGDIWLHEMCLWYDIDGDGIEERCIVTFPDSDPSKVLRFIEMPYDHGMWPYVLVKREMTDAGVLTSRGIPALDEDFQLGVSTAVNQIVDNGTITNSPIVVSKRNTLVNPRNLRYTPGNYVETNGPTADFEIRQLTNISQGALFQLAQYLKSVSDMRIGNVTSGLSESYNLPGQGQQGNKTAKEINSIEALQSQVQSLDLQVFQDQFQVVHYQIWALYEQFGDDEEELIITGEKPQKISRREIQGKFNIVPNGRLDNTNPQLRAQKSFTLLRAFLNDPDIRQDELKKQFLMDYDVKLLNKLFKTPEEKQMEAQALAQQQEMAKQEAIRTQLGLRAAGDNMDIRKEAVLSTIQGKKYAED